MKKSIISGNELSHKELVDLIELSAAIKKNPRKYSRVLGGKRLLLLFQKSATRTRAVFELGMKALGGETVVMDWEKSNLAISPIKYEAAFLSRVFDCVLARLIKNEDMRELGDSLSIPSINGCCNMYHPSQALADFMTVYETNGSFDTSLCYVGVQNNVANSLLLVGLKLGVRFVFVTPLKDPVPDEVGNLLSSAAKTNEISRNKRGQEKLKQASPGSGRPLFEQTDDLEYAVSHCRYVYTDTWINMELFNKKEYRDQQEERIRKMLPYQVNKKLVEHKNVYIMHDMPVHPGFEIDEYAIACKNSLMLQQAENRLYTAQALLLKLLKPENSRLLRC